MAAESADKDFVALEAASERDIDDAESSGLQQRRGLFQAQSQGELLRRLTR
jgi:hypothetical protein